MINGKRVVAVISARMNSSRLPGKAMMPLVGKPVLWHIVERLKASKYIDASVIATTTNSSDDVIESFCQKKGISVFRGSEEDVLKRVHDAASAQHADIVYRGMGDTPLVDAHIVDQLIEILEKGKYDFVSNELREPAFPVGFDATVISFSALDIADKSAVDKEDREHVTLYVYRQPERFNIYSLTAPEELLLSDLRLTLDTPEDYALISKVYEALFSHNSIFSAYDVVRFLRQHPELVALNARVAQRKPTTFPNIN